MKSEVKIEVVLGDRSSPKQDDLMPVAVVLDRLRSAYNTGNIFRLAEATRVSRIFACGYTPAPPHEKLRKTARGCDELVECETYESAFEAILYLKSCGFTIYGVDTVVGAVDYRETEFQFPAAFVMGNEALGISKEALEQCDAFVSLPAFGCKNSINVGNCCAVVLFEALHQWKNRKKGSG